MYSVSEGLGRIFGFLFLLILFLLGLVGNLFRIVRSKLSATYQYIIGNQVLIAVIFLLIVSVPIIYITNKRTHYDTNMINGILGNLNGTVVEFFLLGVIFVALNQISSRAKSLRDYQNTIDDFKNWQSEEAYIRIISAVKRMNALKGTGIDISGIYFSSVELKDLKLVKGDFSNSKMIKCTITSVYFSRCNLKNGRYKDVSFKNCKFPKTDLAQCIFVNCKFTDCDLSDIYVSSQQEYYSDYMEIPFINCQFSNVQMPKYWERVVKIDDSEKQKMEFIGERNGSFGGDIYNRTKEEINF